METASEECKKVLLENWTNNDNNVEGALAIRPLFIDMNKKINQIEEIYRYLRMNY